MIRLERLAMTRVLGLLIFNLFIFKPAAQPVGHLEFQKSNNKPTKLQTLLLSGKEILYENTTIQKQLEEEQIRLLGNKSNSIQLPSELDYVSDVTEPTKISDTPVFWHVHKAGGTTVVDIFSTCFGFVVAAEVGVLEGHGEEMKIRVVTLNGGLHYVNVDTTTKSGIERAARLRLVPTHLADVIVTPYYMDAASMLFNPGNKARMFTILRHPIDRAVSLFFYIQNATWETTYDESMKSMTLEQYLLSDKVEENWMTRFLVNKPTGPLVTDDVILAREIMRRKFLIGLLSHMDESIVRFERYFKWNVSDKDKKECVAQKWTNKHQHPKLEEGSNMWNALAALNVYDIELYHYAEELFHQQRDYFVWEGEVHEEENQ